MATNKQKKAAKILSENIRSGEPMKPMGEILSEAGYADSTTKNPDQVTESKGWAEVMDEHFPDELIAETIGGGLKADKVISANVFPEGRDGKPVNDFIEVPDWTNRLKASEIAAKLKNKNPTEKHEVELKGELKNLTEDQLNERVARIIEKSNQRGKAGTASDRDGEEAPQG